MKGIITVGGRDGGLGPISVSVPKEALPVYDKPLIYYPLSVLLLARIRDVIIVSSGSEDSAVLRALLGDGSALGIRLSYLNVPLAGIRQPLHFVEHFVGNDPVCVISGDNIFYGQDFSHIIRKQQADLTSCSLFGYSVSEPSEHSIAELDKGRQLCLIEEKPSSPPSNVAVTGMYMYTSEVFHRLTELERLQGDATMTDLNNSYAREGLAKLTMLGRGFSWFEIGGADSLLQASQFVRVLQHRQGIRIACIEEVAMRMGYITAREARALGEVMQSSSYGEYVIEIAETGGSMVRAM